MITLSIFYCPEIESGNVEISQQTLSLRQERIINDKRDFSTCQSVIILVDFVTHLEQNS